MDSLFDSADLVIQADALKCHGGYIYPEMYGQAIIMGIISMTAGTIFMMWLGEQIDEYGIGSGISLDNYGRYYCTNAMGVQQLEQCWILQLAPQPVK